MEYILEQEDMKEYIESVKFIKTATVPIIKVTCTEKYCHKKVDFTYQGESHNGLQSVLLIKDYLSNIQYIQVNTLSSNPSSSFSKNSFIFLTFVPPIWEE